MTHWFLSPHFDDAAFSCGGHIAQLTRQGEHVIIYTAMAGEPPRAAFDNGSGNAAALQKWKQASAYVLARRVEDQAAAAVLGADLEFGPFLDAIYRVNPETGRKLYLDVAAIFGAIQPNDPLNQPGLVPPLALAPGDVLHAPLAVGRHVDHRLILRMARTLARADVSLYYYEDFPYTRQGEVGIQEALTLLNLPVERVVYPLDKAAIEARIMASTRYISQLCRWETSSECFGDEMYQFICETGGEREWHDLPMPQMVQ